MRSAYRGPPMCVGILERATMRSADARAETRCSFIAARRSSADIGFPKKGSSPDVPCQYRNSAAKKGIGICMAEVGRQIRFHQPRRSTSMRPVPSTYEYHKIPTSTNC